MTRTAKHITALALALMCATFAFADSRREAEAMIPVAVRLIGADRLEEAGKYLSMAEQLDPGNDAVQYYKGMLLIAASSKMSDVGSKEMINCLSAAGRCFAKAAAADTSNLWYKRRLGNLLFMLKQDREASEVYTKILERSPFDTETLSRLADVYINLGLYEKADSLLSRVETIEGQNGLTQLSRLELLRQKGDYKAFFAAMLRFISEPSIGAADKCGILSRFISSNSAAFNQSHLADYDALVQRSMEVYPGDTTVLSFAAGFYYSMGNYSRTLDLCGENPSSRPLSYLRFTSHMMLGDYQAAIQDCDRLALLAGNDTVLLSEIHCSRADCLQYCSRTGEAYREYELALKLNPGNIVALNNYAYLMACRGRSLSRCRSMMEKVLEAEPDNPTYLDTYGWVLHRQKKNVEAKAVFKKAMLYGGKENAEVLLHYAEVLESLGENSVAEVYRAEARLKKK